MSKPLKWTLGILGTIMLGALGSGFWDLFLRNAFIAVGHGILTLVTLGLSSVRDTFYVEIAKGRTDRVGLYLMTFTFIFRGGMAGALTRIIKVGDTPGSDMTVREHRFFRRFALLSCLLFSSILLFRSVSITYTSQAIDHFEQSFAICLPFMSAQDRDEIRSRFARIRTKTDYVTVLSILEEKARKNNVEIPKFSVW